MTSAQITSSFFRTFGGMGTLARRGAVFRQALTLTDNSSTVDVAKISFVSHKQYRHYSRAGSSFTPLCQTVSFDLSGKPFSSSHLASPLNAVIQTQVRWKSRMAGIGKKIRAQKRDDSDDEDSDNEDEDDDDDDEPVDLSLARNETNLGKESKTMLKQLPYPRAELVIAYVLGLSHDEFLEVFYQGHVYLNGQLLQKKARILSRADKLDVVQEIDEEAKSKTVIRIVVMEITPSPDKKVKMEMEVWKPGIRIKYTS